MAPCTPRRGAGWRQLGNGGGGSHFGWKERIGVGVGVEVGVLMV